MLCGLLQHLNDLQERPGPSFLFSRTRVKLEQCDCEEGFCRTEWTISLECLGRDFLARLMFLFSFLICLKLTKNHLDAFFLMRYKTYVKQPTFLKESRQFGFAIISSSSSSCVSFFSSFSLSSSCRCIENHQWYQSLEIVRNKL